MELMKRLCRSHCPIVYALDIFGDTWSLLVLRDVLFMGKRYYHQFLASEERISTNILANRLRRLEAEGLIVKRRDPKHRRQFIYTPTQKSLDLLPVILEIIRWSAKYDEQTAAPRSFVRRLRNDRQGLMREIAAKCK